MRKVVISGSTKSQKGIEKWVAHWSNKKDCIVLNYPKPISQEKFEKLYANVHETFLRDITNANILFIANEKNDIDGYIGAETFAELALGVTQKLLYKKNIEIILAHTPSAQNACYDEIVLWLKLGWITFHSDIPQ